MSHDHNCARHPKTMIEEMYNILELATIAYDGGQIRKSELFAVYGRATSRLGHVAFSRVEFDDLVQRSGLAMESCSGPDGCWTDLGLAGRDFFEMDRVALEKWLAALERLRQLVPPIERVGDHT